jgi:hypothetical protein
MAILDFKSSSARRSAMHFNGMSSLIEKETDQRRGILVTLRGSRKRRS